MEKEETRSGVRHLLSLEAGEKFLGMARYRDVLLIATDRRLLEWNGDVFQVIEFDPKQPLTQESAESAYHHAHPFGI